MQRNKLKGKRTLHNTSFVQLKQFFQLITYLT